MADKPEPMDLRVTEGGTLLIETPNTPGHRITELWAYISVDPATGDEGVCAFAGPMGWMPMVASDEKRRDLLRPKAEEMAKEGGKPIRLRHFSQAEDVEVFGYADPIR